MPAVIPNANLTRILDDMRQDGDEIMGYLRLFKNNYTPTTASTAGDFTEADFSGYTAWAFDQAGTTWPAAALDGSNNAQSAHAAVDFTHNGGATPNDIYGVYMTDAGGNLICAERYAGAPFTMQNLGDKFTVTPTAKLKR